MKKLLLIIKCFYLKQFKIYLSFPWKGGIYYPPQNKFDLKILQEVHEPCCVSKLGISNMLCQMKHQVIALLFLKVSYMLTV
jgi:hypothetical protein